MAKSENKNTSIARLKAIQKALEDSGHQRRIAEVGMEVVSLLLRKNSDYGNSAFKKPVLSPGTQPSDAILVRMSDKISRLNNLKDGKGAKVEESIRDTMTDLAGYAILWLVATD